MNYTDLRAAIQEYTENYEATFAERIDTFIRQAENRLSHLVRMPPTYKQAAGVLTLGDVLLAPPTDFLSTDALSITLVTGEMVPLENKNADFLRTCYPTTTAGQPRYYAILDETALQVAPAPDFAYPTQLNYFAYAPSIVTAGTSYLGDRCESLLLYTCLVEAYTFMKGEIELMNWYDKRFGEAAALFQQLSKGRQKKDSYQEPDRRVEV